jgi:glycosyltransferase involved in cell wall biosynthesis
MDKIDHIEKYHRSSQAKYDFSVLIPTWNNIHYIKLALRSLQQNSTLSIQAILIINEGKDGTLEWVKKQGEIDYIFSTTNLGICYGLNLARSLVKSDYIVYANDDMYFLPDWDIHLLHEIKRLNTKNFMLSGTMIEYHESGNPCVAVADYGQNYEDFQEQKLLQNYRQHSIPNWNGSSWPPSVMHIDMWDLVGGMSVEFSPGFYSDPDLSKKLYEAGVREFIGVGKSLVYHFGSKSTKRVKVNKGRKTFALKWNMSSHFFYQKVLKMGQPYSTKLPETFLNSFKDKLSQWLRQAKYLFKG